MDTTLKYSGSQLHQAYCDDCGKEWASENGMAIAKRHHDATGHTVHVEQIVLVTWCLEGSRYHLDMKAEGKG
jgi:hypothetical protein